MTEQGYIHDVRTVHAGGMLVGSAAIGATVLTVEDSADFSDTGGMLTVTSIDVDSSVVTSQYAYASVDFDLDVITLSATDPLTMAAADGDRVEVWPTANTKRAVVMLTDTDEAVTAEVAHALRDLIPEGIRDEGQREFVSVELISHSWVLTDVLGSEPSIQSQNYLEATQGWSMSSSGAVFANASVVDTLGADTLSTNTIQLGELDLIDDVISPFPLGLIAHGVMSAATVDTAAVSAETIMFRFNVGAVFANRVYRVSFGGHTLASGSVVGDLYFVRIKYTIDGTQPTLTSTLMDRSMARWGIDNVTGGSTSFDHSFYYLPLLDYPAIIMAICAGRSAGTGTLAIQAANQNYGFYVSVEDMGNRTSCGGTMSLVSVASGTGDTTTPAATYTKTYWQTASQSYDWDGTQRASDQYDGFMFQGRYSATHGNTRSDGIFNSAQMRTDLAGATIKSCKLTYRVGLAYSDAGLDVRVSWHNYASVNATQGTPATLIASRNHCAEGSTYTVDLGVSFGNNLRDGNYRGIVFYGPTTSAAFYGYMYGGGSSSSRPRITITYTK